MLAASASSTFDEWVVRTQVELATLRKAAAGRNWLAAQVSVEAVDKLLKARPAGDPATVTAVLTAARSTVDEAHAVFSEVSAAVGTELRQLGLGRKALKAYR